MECQNCAFNPIVKAISSILSTTTVVIDRKNIPLNPIEYMVHRHKKTNPKVAKAAAALAEPFARVRSFIETEMLPKCQEVCMTCAKNSDDDNLSRCGQTMVFMEAMPGAAGELVGDATPHSGEDGSENADGGNAEDERDRKFFEDADDDDSGEVRGNWLNVHAIRQTKDGSSSGVSALPSKVESDIKLILSAFKDLTVLQQCVLLQRWNEMSFVDIGAMNWVPDELKRHNDKQLVSFWWRQIVQKFPWADVLSSKKRKKGEPRRCETSGQEDDDFASHSPSESYSVQEFDFGDGL